MDIEIKDTLESEMFGFDKYVYNVMKYLGTIEQERLISVINLFLNVHRKHKIFVMGNGGSISTASHFANDLKSISPGFMTICLNDVNTMTCIANDRGYENVFYEQIISLASSDDLVIMLSASGSSPNLLKAVEGAKFQLAKTIAIVGFDGGKLKGMTDICLHVESPVGSYREVEDCHSILCHYFVNVIDKLANSLVKVGAGFNRGNINIFENI